MKTATKPRIGRIGYRKHRAPCACGAEARVRNKCRNCYSRDWQRGKHGKKPLPIQPATVPVGEWRPEAMCWLSPQRRNAERARIVAAYWEGLKQAESLPPPPPPPKPPKVSVTEDCTPWTVDPRPRLTITIVPRPR